jgi:hypothetical protein
MVVGSDHQAMRPKYTDRKSTAVSSGHGKLTSWLFCVRLAAT